MIPPTEEIIDGAKRCSLVPVITLFFLALGLRLVRLFDLDLCFDETVLLFIAESPFTQIPSICRADNFPPLYPWLIKLWVSVSSHPDWYRLFAALLGSLTPPVAFLLGRELLDKRLGWLLGITAAVSVPLIFHSQIVRMFNIQPLLMCLSLLWFIKAVRTNEWRYWLLTAFANLLGFYVYIFMVFTFGAELLVLYLYFRLALKRYLRPFVSQIPFFLGVLLWIVLIRHRFAQVQGEFWVLPLSWLEVGKVWFLAGTGSDFRDYYGIAILLNLPFLVGFLWALLQVRRNEALKISTLVFLIIVVVFLVISSVGQSFFDIRYLYFVIPIYLAISILGWLSLNNVFWRRFGLGWLVFSLLLSLVYFYVDYYEMHDWYAFVRSIPHAEKGEGHNLSKIASDVVEHIANDEVIIHYSDPYSRICSFYATLYYHQRQFSEHIFSKGEIAQHNGRQYLRPGEWIRSLSDLNPLPSGIWMISLNKTEDFFNEEVLEGLKPPHWVAKENLPKELQEAGYFPIETLRRGKVTAIHFRRRPDLSPEQIKELWKIEG